MTNEMKHISGIQVRASLPGGAYDILTFVVDDHWRAHNGDQYDGWLARIHNVHGLVVDYYHVHPNLRGTGYWAERPDHPILGPFVMEGMRDRDHAFEECARDYAKVARLIRWHSYMLTREPPSGGIPL
jgi:hypothetical protein